MTEAAIVTFLIDVILVWILVTAWRDFKGTGGRKTSAHNKITKGEQNE